LIKTSIGTLKKSTCYIPCTLNLYRNYRHEVWKYINHQSTDFQLLILNVVDEEQVNETVSPLGFFVLGSDGRIC